MARKSLTWVGRVGSRTALLMASPVNLALLAYVGAIVLIAPWSDYPLNDDWMYAWIAKRFAETGVLKIDMRLAPSLVVQTLMTWPLIKLLGFSHTILRSLTICMGGLLLVLADGMLKLCGVLPRVRTVSLLLWVFNPLFLCLACSFMTEIYGYVFAMGGCLLWLYGRVHGSPGRPLGWCSALGAAALTGVAFWTRQLSALLFAPLWLSSAVMLARGAGRVPQRKAFALWGPLVAAAIVHAGIIAAYFPWARAHGALRSQFAEPLANLKNLSPTHIDWAGAGMSLYCLAMYTAFFALPLLCFPEPWRKIWPNRWLIAVLAVLEYLGFHACATLGTPWEKFGTYHRWFPLLTNIVTDYGIGPTNFGDRFIQNAVRPGTLPFWGPLYILLLTVTPIFLSYWLRAISACVLRHKNILCKEGCIFGLGLGAGALGIVNLAFRQAIFDRYLVSSLIGVWFASSVAPREGKFLSSGRHRAIFALLLLPLAYYSVASLHDYFRWNDIRWDLYARAQTLGAGPLDVEGGYELNGWEIAVAHAMAPEANTGYFTEPRRFAITLTESPGTRTADGAGIHPWIMQMPPLLLREKMSF